MDESTLIQAAIRGDVDSFNQIVLAYQDIAYTVAYRIMGESDAAADAAQEAFISAYQKLHQFRGEHFKPWLMRIVTNSCYDELRRRQRRPALSLDALHEVQTSAGLDLHSPQENPEQHSQRRELNSAIQDCLSDLPDDQRVIAVLSDVEGYAYQEIAEITGLPLGTVKSRLSRARGRLRDCLREVRELLPAEYRLMNNEEPAQGAP
ncbi:MAG: sigma-70 family RNA polymerase sigma factor [Chloroflexi bacterium]|nr:MAG: sigma-70 family RNA polymerase sigma factor [Chloroflexota bacterium]